LYPCFALRFSGSEKHSTKKVALEARLLTEKD